MRERLYNLPLPTKDHIQLSGPSEILLSAIFPSNIWKSKISSSFSKQRKIKEQGPKSKSQWSATELLGKAILKCHAKNFKRSLTLPRRKPEDYPSSVFQSKWGQNFYFEPRSADTNPRTSQTFTFFSSSVPIKRSVAMNALDYLAPQGVFFFNESPSPFSQKSQKNLFESS